MPPYILSSLILSPFISFFSCFLRLLVWLVGFASQHNRGYFIRDADLCFICYQSCILSFFIAEKEKKHLGI